METNKKENPVVICSKTSSHTPLTIGIEVHCVGCNEKVWLSDTSIQAVKKVYEEDAAKCSECATGNCDAHSMDTNPPAPFCMECALKMMKNEGKDNLKFMEYTKEQKDEVLAGIKRNP